MRGIFSKNGGQALKDAIAGSFQENMQKIQRSDEETKRVQDMYEQYMLNQRRREDMARNVRPGMYRELPPGTSPYQNIFSSTPLMPPPTPQPSREKIREDLAAELGKGAMAMRLSELEDLWEVTFGERWVLDSELEKMSDKNFWLRATTRLKRDGRIEVVREEDVNFFETIEAFRLCR
jgi:hypothetical protein